MASNSTFALEIKSNGATKSVNDIKSIGDQIASVGKIAKGAAIGGLIVSGIQSGLSVLQSFAAGSIDAYKEAELGSAKLGAVLKATGYSAGLSQREMEDYASSLQDMTMYEDDAVIASMRVMASFKNINGDVFKKTQKAAMDMATVMDVDLTSAVQVFGKALNDPAEGLSKLERYGIVFTKSQLENIQSLVSAGKMQEAQLLILEEAEKRWGGASEAAAQTSSGLLKQVQNASGDVQEGLGGIALELFSFSGIGDFLKEKLGSWATYLRDHMHEIAYSVSSVGLQIGAMAEKIWVLFDPIWTGITAGIQNIGIMGGWLYENWEKIWDNMGDITIAVGKDILDIFLYIPKQILAYWKEFGKALWKSITDPKNIGENFSKMFSNLAENAVKDFANFGKNTELALGKAGVSDMPQLKNADYSGWTDTKNRFAEIDKRYAGYQDKLDKKLEKAYDKDNAKGIKTPAKIEVAQVAQPEAKIEPAKVEEPKYAAFAEKGSQEAWKTILANQPGAKSDIAEKQLSTQQAIKDSVDKVASVIQAIPTAKSAASGGDWFTSIMGKLIPGLDLSKKAEAAKPGPWIGAKGVPAIPEIPAMPSVSIPSVASSVAAAMNPASFFAPKSAGSMIDQSAAKAAVSGFSVSAKAAKKDVVPEKQLKVSTDIKVISTEIRDAIKGLNTMGVYALS